MSELLRAEDWASPVWLDGLWLVPVLLALSVWAVFRRRRAMERFAEASLLARIGGVIGSTRLLAQGLLVALAAACLIVALARPLRDRSERTITREGRDVVFVVDVSRSMLADDLAPNRLERTKLWIRDVVPTLDGDRVGLVAFAGTSVVKCPLTLDYAFFDLALEELDVDSVSRGGTMIGDALRKANEEVFDSFEGRFRDVLLFTDGEDQGSAPLEAARAAAERGIRLIAFGLGDDAQGTRIPNPDPRAGSPYIVDDAGREVRSRLDRDTLEAMARATPGGVYVHVGTGTVELDRLYDDLIKDASKSAVQEETIVEYDERFQTWLGMALALLLVAGLLGGVDP